MKVLFVVPYAPTAIRTRPYNLLRALARRGHDLTLATLWETEAERAALDQLRQWGVRVVDRPLTRRHMFANGFAAVRSTIPLQARYSWQPALAAALSELAVDRPAFDVVHGEHLRGAEYTHYVQRHLRRNGHTTPVVWDSVDCISLLFSQAARSSRSRLGRWVARLELPRTRRYEGRMVRQFSRVLATSAADRDALEALGNGQAGGVHPQASRRPGCVSVIPNGVDLDYFTPPAWPSGSDQVILSGKMSYHANVTAALHLVDDIMPRVWAHRPGVRIVIAGSKPPREVRALAARYAPRVTVTGTVSDLRPYLWSARVAVAPIAYGVGIQNKVLEAMACALPVVVSAQAGSALEAQDGRDLVVANSAEAFAAAILRLLEAPARRNALGQAARAYVTAHHVWDAIAGRLEALYAEEARLTAIS